MANVRCDAWGVALAHERSVVRACVRSDDRSTLKNERTKNEDGLRRAARVCRERTRTKRARV